MGLVIFRTLCDVFMFWGSLVYSHVVKEIGCPICFENVFWQYSRNISQSRWMIDDERMGEGSVQVSFCSVFQTPMYSPNVMQS
jgi:tRNA U54 and U55 pseudouridine synthase Pus10